MRDDGGLDKGGNSRTGSKGTVFAERVDVRYESKTAFRMTPRLLASASGRMEFLSTEMGKSPSGESLG